MKLNTPLGRDPRAASADRAEAAGELIRVAAMDAHFRRICAVFTDRRCLVARGYEGDNRLRRQLLAMRESGDVPKPLDEESVELEVIAGLWGEDMSGRGVAEGGGSAEWRIMQLFEDAAAARASDVVFELAGSRCVVHGIVNDRKLPLGPPLTAEEGREVMGMLFHCKDEGSSQTSYQRSAFQGFSVRAGGRLRLPGGISALRCQRGPHEPDGDHLFARLFYADQLEAGMTLEGLGFSEEEAEIFAEIRMSLHGGIFLGGTTGDGKTTTLAVNLALQMAEMGNQLNLVTIEDPVEYRIPGAVQIAVPTTGTGETRAEHFAKALMHFCRVHPSSGMVSEIRDADAAREVLQFIDTGHQVWTTIHVDNANAILFRLVDLGVGVGEVCKPGNIKLLMKQTLLSRLCPACAGDAPAGARAVPPWLAQRMEGWRTVRYRNPEGCPECRRAGGSKIAAAAWNGYTGQQAVAEMIQPDARYLGFVRDRDPLRSWAFWRDEMGGTPIGTKIWHLVAEGAVDPFDALIKGARTEREMAPPLSVVGGGAE